MITRIDRVTWDSVTHIVLRYGTAVASTALAVWSRRLLQPWLADECPFSLFYLSVLLTAWIAGTGPAIFAIGLGTWAAAQFFIPPTNSLWIEDGPEFLQLLIYVFVNVIATLLFNRLENQRLLAENRSEENERLSQSLREADERKDEFLALLAHELRNPLAPIRSSLALLERKQDSPETIHRVRDVISRHTNQLVRLTDDLLDVSRFCRGKITLQSALFDLRDAIHDAVEMNETLILEKSHRFHLLIPNTPVWINGDRVRLTQLTSNLIGNAAKYTPECGRITVQVEVIDDSIHVAVSDNGIGFAPSESERILEPFTQIDTSRTRDYGGLGVGLTIVQRLVTLHGGKLEVFSRGPGMGSQFTVVLSKATPPVSYDAPKTEPTLHSFPSNDHHVPSPNPFTLSRSIEHESTETVTNEFSSANRRLLIVEDNRDAAELLSELFQSEGYQVQLASDGVDALQQTCRFSPDVVILDIGLPGMDGYEVARRINRLQLSRRPRLIALTGWGSQADREAAVSAGFDFHLVKPLVFRELLHYVEDEHPNGCLREASCRPVTG